MIWHLSLVEWLLLAPAILLALTVHEMAHAYVAYLHGDPTASREGRITLNPLKHLDPVGTLLLLLTGFGWAKPVPINPFYFRGDRNRGVFFTSLAGPGANLILSFLAVLMIKVLLVVGITSSYLIVFFKLLALINIGLGLFNLLPVPPLDGSKILASLLPPERRYIVYEMERYGFLILILLLYFGGDIIGPLRTFLYNLELALVGLSGL